MIDEEETYRRFGYHAWDLKPKSHKKIIAVCDGCGKVRELKKEDYRELCTSCVQKGKHHSRETRRKIGDAARGEKHYNFGKHLSEETRRKLSNAQKGKKGEKAYWYGKHLSKEARRKMSKSHKGKHLSGETRQKLSESHIQYYRNHPEVCAMISEANRGEMNPFYGKHPSDEARKKNREAHKGKHHSGEARKKMSESHKGEKNHFFGKRHTEEARRKMREAEKGEKNHNWQGGISFEPYCPKFNEAFKESVREEFGRVCFLCPKTEEQNGRKLSIHHVNYNKDCLCDSSNCYFVPLCISCHTKTNFNRDYWEGLIMDKLRELGIK